MNNELRSPLNGKKILFATCPADGHFNPLTGLAKYLQEQGCEVKWYTSITYANKLARLAIPHYPFESALDVNGENFEEIFPERKLIKDPIEKINFDMINAFYLRSVEYYADLQRIHQLFDFDLLICDNMFSAVPFVKLKMEIPVIGIGVIPLPQESVDLAPYGMALPPADSVEKREEYAKIRDLAKKVLFKESIAAFNELLNKHGLDNNAMPSNMLIDLADFFLQIGTPGFEYERSDLGENIRFVGPLMPYSTGQKTEKWYDARIEHYQQIILVTQGTVEKDTAKLLEPTIDAFKDTDVLLIATTGGVNTALLREKYPYANVIIEDSIPFDQVMPYADLFITNGGYGGTLYSIKHGLPIVAAGVHEGKNEICARIGFLKYGINLNTEFPEPGDIKAAVNKILADGSYTKNMVRLAEEMQEYKSLELCTAYINDVLVNTKLVS